MGASLSGLLRKIISRYFLRLTLTLTSRLGPFGAIFFYKAGFTLTLQSAVGPVSTMIRRVRVRRTVQRSNDN